MMTGHGWHDTGDALEFPPLSRNLHSKNTKRRKLHHPAKRPKIERRLNGGMDDFCFLESLLLEEPSQGADELAPFPSVISELGFDQNDLPCEQDGINPPIDSWDLLSEFDTMPTTIQGKMADTKVFDRYSTANNLFLLPSIENNCTYKPMIDRLEGCKGPALLMLTSFPFRVVYANEMYTRLTKGKPVIGESIFLSVEAEGVPQSPSFGSYPELLDKLLHETISVQIATSSGNIPCTINTYPVMEADQGMIDLRSYIVLFQELATNTV
eukprot:scaffold21455_cov116-Cylindrotheca_fusiformis.AAC.8